MTHLSLLPPNRTAWETAVATVEAERAIPAHLVSTVFNPETCPVHLLPYLASALSVDVWDDAWTETKKREVCRKSLGLHRIKTTLAGIKAHVALTGAEVTRAIRPPANGFLYAAMTESQRASWLDTLPQIRLYPFSTNSVAVGRHFAAGPGARQFHSSRTGGTRYLQDGAGSFLVDEDGAMIAFRDGPAVSERPGEELGVSPVVLRSGFMRSSRGRSLYGRRATLFDLGVETEIQYEASDGEAVERVFIGRTRKREWHGARHLGQGHLTQSQAAEGVVTVRLDQDAGIFAIGAGLEPVDVRPQRIYQARTAPDARSFCGRPRAGTFLRHTHGPILVYDRISIHTPDRMGARRRTRNFHGYGRFGIPDFTAELRVHVPMLRGRRRSGRWHGVGYRQAADMAPLRKAIEAVRVSKAFRDTVMIDTATYGQVKFSGGMRFGDFTFGEIREAR